MGTVIPVTPANQLASSHTVPQPTCELTGHCSPALYLPPQGPDRPCLLDQTPCVSVCPGAYVCAVCATSIMFLCVAPTTKTTKTSVFCGETPANSKPRSWWFLKDPVQLVNGILQRVKQMFGALGVAESDSIKQCLNTLKPLKMISREEREWEASICAYPENEMFSSRRVCLFVCIQVKS
ncbi:hypothetical protein PO909_033412 [Leuciscus waleckii]